MLLGTRASAAKTLSSAIYVYSLLGYTKDKRTTALDDVYIHVSIIIIQRMWIRAMIMTREIGFPRDFAPHLEVSKFELLYTYTRSKMDRDLSLRL